MLLTEREFFGVQMCYSKWVAEALSPMRFSIDEQVRYEITQSQRGVNLGGRFSPKRPRRPRRVRLPEGIERLAILCCRMRCFQ